MKIHRPHPVALIVSLAAAGLVIGADTTPKSGKAAAKATPAAATVASGGDVVALVNGEPIKSSELEDAFKKAVASRGMPVDGVPPDQKKAALRMLLDDMVNERLLDKACADVKIEGAAVDAEFAKIKQSRGLSDEAVEKELAGLGMTIESLKANIQKRMKQRQWMDEQIKGKTAESTDADAKEFFEKNPQHFETPEMVRASHILFRLAPESTPEQVTATLKKAEAASGRAKKEDFAKLAAELSEEPGAAERGGDLNFFPRQGAMVEEFAQAAFKLKKDEISPEPVRTQFGYHVIKVTDRKAAGKQSLDEAKPQILAHLTRERKRLAIDGVVNSLRTGSDVKITLPGGDAPAGAATPPGAK
jgi:peptidyl-prolyl cis-trans isomerase C